jgi:tRNA(Ile)-lysidine synthase
MAEDFDPELKLDARKTNDIVSLVSDSCGTKEVNLSKHVKAVREYDKLMFLRKGMEDSGYEEKISIPGKLKIKKHNLLITSMLCSKRSKNRNPFEVEIDYDKITYPLVIRTRRRGDIFCPIGLKGKKKVKDIFIDAKIPERLRNVVPLFVSGGDICWIPGYRIGEHYKITRDTKKILKIKTKGVENLWQTEVQS